MPIKTIDDAIALVNTKANGRTRYEGQEPFVDELLVAEIERLRAENAELLRLAQDARDAFHRMNSPTGREIELQQEVDDARATQAICVSLVSAASGLCGYVSTMPQMAAATYDSAKAWMGGLWKHVLATEAAIKATSAAAQKGGE